MAKKQIIAYYMHEEEQAVAVQYMTGAQFTESFAIGEVEEAEIRAMEHAGLVVRPNDIPQTLPSSNRPGQESVEPRVLGAPDIGGGRMVMEPREPSPLPGEVPGPVEYYLVTLHGPLIETWREQLQALGVALLEVASKYWNTYKARLGLEQVSRVDALPFVIQVRWIAPSESPPDIMTRSTPSGTGRPPTAGVQMLTFDVRVHAEEDAPTVIQWLRDRHVNIAGSSRRKVRFYALEDSPTVNDLTVLPEVDTVVEYQAPELYVDRARGLIGLDAPSGQTPSTYLTQDGTGQTIGVADTGIDDQHPDFKGRIVAAVAKGRAVADDPNGHGTHVAGIALGDGTASNGQIRGVAPGANLYFQSLLDAKGKLGGLPLDLNDLFAEAYNAGVRIHNNSWGAVSSSVYTLNSEEADEFVHTHPDMLLVIAAGNAGTGSNPIKASAGFVDWLSIGSPASCKNALTVGASRSDRVDGSKSATTWGQSWPNLFPSHPISNDKVSGDPECLAAFSSRGPCDDRRIKPDLVAPGTDVASARSSQAPMTNFWGPYPTNLQPEEKHNDFYAFDGGTSMAAPIVAGCAALVRQYYVQTCAHQPSAALLKATLVNSTVWLKGEDAVAPTTGRPNYHQGHGRVCLQNAIPNSSDPDWQLRFVDDWQNPAKALVLTGARRRFRFQLLAGADELRICLCYTDTPARGLQNNVNLIIHLLGSSFKCFGNQDLPDQLIVPDRDNNLETVRIKQPAAGLYLVQVFAGNLLKTPQHFALAVAGKGISPLTEI